MKIYLSKYWRKSSFFILFLMVFLILFLVVFCVWSNNRREDYIIVLCVAWFELILGCILLFSKRFLTYAKMEEHEIHSFSIFSQKLCKIRTSDPIYYAVFATPQGALSRNRFIALSNESFEYRATYGVAKVRFIQHYDMEKQIVLPYNEQTIPFLNLEEWHRVN